MEANNIYEALNDTSSANNGKRLQDLFPFSLDSD